MKYLIFIWKKFSRSNAIFCAFLISGLSLVIPSRAQGPKECGNPEINMEALLKAEKFATGQANLAAPSPVMIRVYFHICRNNDGTNAGATEIQIKNEFDQLVADFAGDNICFVNMGVNYIDDTQINTNLDADIPSNVDWLNPHLVPNCINIFYHANLPRYGGNAYKIPNTFCSVTRGNINLWRTISHEVGHCLGLLHTFQSCNGSYINGTNCSSTGDRVCDTPADPYCFSIDNNSCFKNSGCSYTGTCQDAGMQTNWSPPYDNIMSYWGVRGCTLSTFTSGQYTRTRSFLNTDAGLQGCTSPSSDVVSNINISSGYYFASAINDLTTSGTVNISGTANATFAGATVLLEPGFRASPEIGGLVLLRPTSCTFSASAPIAKTNSEAIANSEIIKKNEQTALLAYPNPASSDVRLVFSLKKNEKNTLLKVYNINGKKVKEIMLGYLSAGKQTVQLNLSSFSSGVYYVYLQFNTGRLATKVVLAK